MLAVKKPQLVNDIPPRSFLPLKHLMMLKPSAKATNTNELANELTSARAEACCQDCSVYPQQPGPVGKEVSFKVSLLIPS